MKRAYILDLEADSLLKDATKIHCLSLRNIEDGSERSFTLNSMGGYPDLEEGLELSSGASLLVAHNGLKFDFPLIEKLYPHWKRPGKILDTLILTRLMWPKLKVTDLKLIREKKLDQSLWGSHSLKAWGQRLGNFKGDYTGEWGEWSEEMHHYMIQDTSSTLSLYKHCQEAFRKGRTTKLAIELEHQATVLCALIERNGFPFDEQAAQAFYGTLQAKAHEQEQELQAALGSIFVKVPSGSITPKKDNAAKGYTEGAPLTRVTVKPVNPSSTKQMGLVLQKRFGWKPKDFTGSGQPKLDDTIIDDVPLPGELKAKLKDYLTTCKVKGFLVSNTGKGWINLAKDGRIHAEYNVQGADTGRATHSSPNITQVPSVRAAYGSECRGLFGPVPGWKQIGCDLSGLELRLLANALFPYDGGSYATIVLTGDVHVANQRAAGLPTRDTAKTFIYAWLYGAGDYKIGTLMVPSKEEAIELVSLNRGLAERLIEYLARDFGRKPDTIEVATAIKGKQVKARFLKGVPALGQLKDELIWQSLGFRKTSSRSAAGEAFKSKYDGSVWEPKGPKGYILGLDGRFVGVKSEHSTLNYRLQGEGALVCKRWIIQAEQDLKDRGWDHGADFQFHAFVHDEVQISSRPEIAEEVREIVIKAAPKVGQFFNLNVPIAAEGKIGSSWRECH